MTRLNGSLLSPVCGPTEVVYTVDCKHKYQVLQDPIMELFSTCAQGSHHYTHNRVHMYMYTTISIEDLGITESSVQTGAERLSYPKEGAGESSAGNEDTHVN